MTFNQFGFNSAITAGIEAQGFVEPTAIQKQAIPVVLAGDDVMGLAQTGTGKTAAFVLPALQHLMNGPKRQLRMLVLTPTRELAEQIHTVIEQFQAHTKISSMAIYGGVSGARQVQRLRRGVDIVVACPGRLLDHIRQGAIDLSGIEICVLDEADQMFDRGFLPDVRQILKQLPQNRQNLMFSATMPDEVRRLSRDILRNPVTVEAAHVIPVATITHALYPIAQQLKPKLLVELLGQISRESVLIFTRTKHRAKRLAQQLENEGFKTASLQGNLSQNRRREALDGFRDGTYQILVATDIAARGLDISSISHVINFDIPDTVDAYTHRIGRTGRAARTGDAFTFVTREDASMVREIERRLGAPLERRRLSGFEYQQGPEQEIDRGRAPQRSAVRAESSCARSSQRSSERRSRASRGYAPVRAHRSGQASSRTAAGRRSRPERRESRSPVY